VSAARPAPRPFVIGLTGGIGSGKSAAAEEFARLGATVVDTDAIAHELTAAGGAAIPGIEKLLGKDCVLPSGAMDRAKVRARVFSDPAARKALEALLHPLIRERSAERIAAARGPYVIHVVPLLVESENYRARADRVLVVDASEEKQLERVRGRGLGEEESRLRADPEGGLPVAIAHVRDGPRDPRGGGVNEEVEPAEEGDHGLHEGKRGTGDRQVGAKGRGPRTLLSKTSLGLFRILASAPEMDGHVVPGPAHAECQLASEPPAGAGDERDAGLRRPVSGQVPLHSPPACLFRLRSVSGCL